MSDRVQIPTLLVIDALLGQAAEIHGWAVIKEVGLSPGTVYPILRRLEDRGWVTSRWDDSAARRTGSRRYYQFVNEHRAEADRLVTARLGPHRKAHRDV